MKIAHVKTGQYCCDTCQCQFDWGSDSRRYGKMEYKTIQERERIEKLFCSERCSVKHKISKK